jgi:tripartite-type tricarboxylate transporter receptor subunit TctC
MKLPHRRHFLHLTAGAVALSAVPRLALAQAYPVRPVRLLVGFPPGGVTDVVARLIGPVLSERLGQPFAVENRPGASSNIALEETVRAAPDGYTLFLVSATNAFNETLYDNLHFSLARDMAPVASIGRDAFIMVVNPSFPAKSGAEFVAYAKANPGRVNMATSGLGSASDLYGELFKSLAGVDLLAVHYRGVGQALPDLLSGRVDVMFFPLAGVVSYIKAGKLRALGVTTPTRREVVADVPPIGDFVKGYEGTDWTGIGAAANTPPAVIAALNKAVNAVLADATFKARLADLGVEPFLSTPAEFGTFIASYTEQWAKVIRAAGIKAD